MPRKDRNIIPDATESRSGIQKTFVCPGFPAAGGLRDFRNDEIRARDEKIATCITVLAKGKPTAICGPGVLFFQPLPLVTLLTRALLIVTSLVAWENRWILFTHLHTLLLPIWIKSIHSGGRRQGQQLGNQDGISQNYCKIN